MLTNVFVLHLQIGQPPARHGVLCAFCKTRRLPAIGRYSAPGMLLRSRRAAAGGRGTDANDPAQGATMAGIVAPVQRACIGHRVETVEAAGNGIVIDLPS